MGSSQTIAWSSTGSVPNVRIEYSTDSGAGWSTIVSSTANTGTYAWSVPNALSVQCLVRIGNAANAAVSDVSDAVFSIYSATAPTISMSAASLDFRIPDSPAAGPQQILINNSGSGTLNWTASSDQPWLFVSPGSGTGAGIIAVSVDATGLSPGDYSGKVSILATGANNSPQALTVNLSLHSVPVRRVLRPRRD